MNKLFNHLMLLILITQSHAILSAPNAKKIKQAKNTQVTTKPDKTIEKKKKQTSCGCLDCYKGLYHLCKKTAKKASKLFKQIILFQT